jgi:hypothetical protein
MKKEMRALAVAFSTLAAATVVPAQAQELPVYPGLFGDVLEAEAKGVGKVICGKLADGTLVATVAVNPTTIVRGEVRGNGQWQAVQFTFRSNGSVYVDPFTWEEGPVAEVERRLNTGKFGSAIPNDKMYKRVLTAGQVTFHVCGLGEK